MTTKDSKPSEENTRKKPYEEVRPGVLIAYNHAHNGYASYGQRVLMAEDQFNSLKDDISKPLETFTQSLLKNCSHAKLFVRYNGRGYMEVDVQGYSEKDNLSVRKEVSAVIEDACKRHGITYVDPRATLNHVEDIEQGRLPYRMFNPKPGLLRHYDKFENRSNMQRLKSKQSFVQSTRKK
jgi:hypothetical protein